MGKKKVGKYLVDLDNKLGQGSCAQVFMGIDNQTKEQVAVKLIPKQALKDEDGYLQRAFEAEVNIMMRLKSENIIQFLEVNQTKTNYYIMIEYANDGNFRDILQKKGMLPEDKAIQYIVQLLNGFGEMSRIGVTHRDLKPENIFIKNGVLKIGDFGFAKNEEGQDLMSTIVGSPAYMAPQILAKKKYTYKCDIWSLGVMVYEMVTGNLPFQFKSQNMEDMYKDIKNTELNLSSVKVSKELKDFIAGCLKVEEKDRFEWIKIFKHPLFKGIFDKNFEGKKDGSEKMGFIMSNVRSAIQKKAIDLSKVFDKIKKPHLEKQEFLNFIEYTSNDLTAQDRQIVFNQLQKGGKVEIEDIKKLFKKHSCSLDGEGVGFQAKIAESGPETDNNANVLSLMQLKKAYLSSKVNSFELYDQFGGGQPQITFDVFAKIMNKLDPKLSPIESLDLYENYFMHDKDQKINIKKFSKKMEQLKQL